MDITVFCVSFLSLSFSPFSCSDPMSTAARTDKWSHRRDKHIGESSKICGRCVGNIQLQWRTFIGGRSEHCLHRDWILVTSATVLYVFAPFMHTQTPICLFISHFYAYASPARRDVCIFSPFIKLHTMNLWTTSASHTLTFRPFIMRWAKNYLRITWSINFNGTKCYWFDIYDFTMSHTLTAKDRVSRSLLMRQPSFHEFQFVSFACEKWKKAYFMCDSKCR